jgi:hypothetical protein
MDTKAEHRHNAGLEKRWMDDAARDENYLHSAAQRETSNGHAAEARFLSEEARNAGSWVGKRQNILKREERLAGKQRD